MGVYDWLGRVFPKSYIKKVFSAAFVGVHIPLIVSIGYVLSNQSPDFAQYQDTLLWLGLATVIGTGFTWWALHALLAPLFLIEQSMANYERDGVVDTLPDHHMDEVGRVMAQVNRLVFHSERRLNGARVEAHTDPLTLLLNRRGFEARFPTQAVQGELLLLDLNQFKPINDQYGHAMGDAVLQHVAVTLRDQLRLDGDRFDLACRWGGDEFLVFIREIDVATADSIVQSLQSAICAEIVIGSIRLSVSCALGRVRWPCAGSLTDAVVQADRYMYANKTAGQISSSEPPVLEAC
jgi:diguanylate cyclase